jgi:hypothetical protein
MNIFCVLGAAAPTESEFPYWDLFDQVLGSKPMSNSKFMTDSMDKEKNGDVNDENVDPGSDELESVEFQASNLENVSIAGT